MDVANLFKNLVVSVTNLMLQLWCTSDPPPPATPPRPPSPPPSTALDSEEQVAATSVVFAHAQKNLDWTKIVLGFCLSSAVDIALQSVQTQSQLPPIFHWLSLAISFAFASLFVAKFISWKFPIPAQMLEHAAVFFAATAYFVAVTIPFPMSLKCISWAVYVVSLLAILICNRF
ncbi:hypothetical protein L1049_027696 [Liquidambar formosana]|uniref:Uncharacterized protein n=1 Tax=Liquidambar formosana TaxID=63359 RepID=A0AAP0WSQ4_LIQFO